MIEPRFAWRFPIPVTASEELIAAGARHGLGERVVGLLAARGLATAVDVDGFFAEPLAALHDPALLPDAAAFRERIERARAAGEKVMVFGDFDADGLTGLAIMVRALRFLAVDVLPYVPSRLDEGHGLSLQALAAATGAGASVIVTVDCGSTSVAEIAEAQVAGIDVLVTDHHRLPAELPVAVAIVNPKRADSRYPERRLAGSGVAFKLAQLLLADDPGGPEAALALADLATIGSIADLVPILGETRAIVRLGLALIADAPRPGIAALLASASVSPMASDVETLSFAVAPRINAAGRVGESQAAAALLLTDDRAEADALAAELEAANHTRRDLTTQAMSEARAVLAGVVAIAGAAAVDRDPTAPAPDAPTPAPDTLALAHDAPTPAPDILAPAPDAPATIVHGPWPVGIVGLVASRLVDDLGKPAVVGADLGPVIRASCRSDGRLDLGATLEACGDLFLRYGGHAGAAGFEIEAARWPEFVARFGALAATAIPADPRRPLAIDIAMPAIDIDYPLHRDLRRLAPCGVGNPEPMLAVLGLTVTRVRAASGGHSQLTLRRGLDVLDGIAFGRPDLAETIHEGDRVDVVARLTSRTFGGFESLQLEIRDVAAAGLHPDAVPFGGLAAPVDPHASDEPALAPIGAIP